MSVITLAGKRAERTAEQGVHSADMCLLGKSLLDCKHLFVNIWWLVYGLNSATLYYLSAYLLIMPPNTFTLKSLDRDLLSMYMFG